MNHHPLIVHPFIDSSTETFAVRKFVLTAAALAQS
jgi:hypothetical protein